MSSASIQSWVPGVLSEEQVKTLATEDWLEHVNLGQTDAIDGSALDLTLSAEAYEMKLGSVKPAGGSYEQQVLKKSDLAVKLSPKPDGTFALESRKTYVFRLEQELGSRLLNSELIYGQATAKSSVGRMDVLARLIVDGMDRYETFDPQHARQEKGRMFLEVTPITFKVLVKPGGSLSQLRLFKGRPEDCEIRGEVLYRSVLKHPPSSSHPEQKPDDDGTLSVDLSDAHLDGEARGCAFRVQEHRPDDFLPLWEVHENGKEEKPDPKKYWELLRCEAQAKGYLRIEKDKFYILRSRERIALPPGVAVYCRATDETIGEMRIHYAGFVHPRFGFDRKDGEDGTPLIFEVRGHDIEVMLSDAEIMARLTFYRMSLDSQKESSYATQSLQLSKFFKKWY